MFFYLSKIFWAVAQPLSLILLLVVAGFILALMRRRILSLIVQGVAVSVMVLCCFTTLGPLLIRPLEDRFARPEAPEAISAIIVLGGATLSRIGGARGVTELNAAGDRMTEALALARRYPEAPIVFTGGIGSIIAEGETEAASAERFFLAQGLAPERLVIEDAARNTDENAQFTADLLSTSQLPALLVTSAFHMPRSVGLFRKAGVDVVPWPVDYRSTRQEGLEFDIANPVLSLDITSIAIREWIGLLAYHWTGRIDELLPGPQ